MTSTYTSENTLIPTSASTSIITQGCVNLLKIIIHINLLFIIVFYLSLIGKPYLEILPILGLFLAAAYKMVPSFNKILFSFIQYDFTSLTIKFFEVIDEPSNFLIVILIFTFFIFPLIDQ